MVFFCPIFQSLRLHLHDSVLSSIHSAIQPHPPSKPRRAGIKMLFLCKFPVKRTPHFHSGFAVHCPSWEIAAYCPHLIAHKHNLRPHRCVWMQSISAPPPPPQKKIQSDSPWLGRSLSLRDVRAAALTASRLITFIVFQLPMGDGFFLCWRFSSR